VNGLRTGNGITNERDNDLTMERKRINLTVRPELYGQLMRLSRRYGFKNVCALAVCILRLMAQQLAVREDMLPHEETDAELIRQSFAELGEWERAAHKPDEYGQG